MANRQLRCLLRSHPIAWHLPTFILLLPLLAACGRESETAQLKNSPRERKHVSVVSTHPIFPWLLNQCTCDSSTYTSYRDTNRWELGETEDLYGTRRRTEIECDSLWGYSEVTLQFISFDSTIVGVIIDQVGSNQRNWNPPPTFRNRDTVLDPDVDNPFMILIFDSRVSYSTWADYEYFTVEIGGTEWVGAVVRIDDKGTLTATKIYLVPSVSPLTYLRPKIDDELDTLEGGYYHWNGYRYLARKGMHYCWSGLYGPADHVVAGPWLYRIKFPPEYDHFLLNDEKNKRDTSCADIEQVRLIGWVGEGIWQPHGPDHIPTLYVMDAEILSVGMPDRFRD